jgi:hypothetical protein
MRGKLVIMLAALGILVAPVMKSSVCLGGWAPSVQSSHQNSLKAGIDAFHEGALEVSVEALSNALEGKLSTHERAQALYFRGLAYRELGLPGQAILDLTGAISIKGGLSKAHLKDAEKHRAGAYREAGMSPKELVLNDATVNGSRTAVPVPPGRVPVPHEQRQPWVPLTTGSITVGQPPAAPESNFISAIEKLIPDWP